MPRIKPLCPEPFTEIRRLLKGYEFDGPKLAYVIGVSEPTARKRLKNPEEFTLGELRKIIRGSDVTADEIREALKFN